MNLVENLPVFASLILVVHLAGVEGAMVSWGAVLFFWARLAHAAIHFVGIPMLRTVAFVVSLIGLLRTLLAVIGAPAVTP